MSTDPVVVLYKSVGCVWCERLWKMWDSVVESMKKEGNIRIFVATASDRSGRVDPTVIPSGIMAYGSWYPMILLVPGKIWNVAIANLGKNEIELKAGIQIMNTEKDASGNFKLDENGKIQNFPRYNSMSPEGYSLWLRDALKTDDFKMVQNDIIPFMPHTKNVIPSNLSNNFVLTQGSHNQQNICSTMRIISRVKPG